MLIALSDFKKDLYGSFFVYPIFKLFFNKSYQKQKCIILIRKQRFDTDYYCIFIIKNI